MQGGMEDLWGLSENSKETSQRIQGFNFLRGTFSKSDTVRAPIKFGTKRKSQHLHPFSPKALQMINQPN